MLFIDDLNVSDVKDVYDLEKFPAPWRYGNQDPYAQPPKRSPVVVSPNIDKLAQNAIIFDRFYITSSVCTPSRYSLLTGQYASQSYSLSKEKMKPGQTVKPVSFNTHIHRDQYTLPEMFKSVGYTTGLVEKHKHVSKPILIRVLRFLKCGKFFLARRAYQYLNNQSLNEQMTQQVRAFQETSRRENRVLP
jgi:hypothetical protein